MPEGDTIHRTARTLHRALATRRVTGFEAADPRLTRVHDDEAVVGRTVERVASRGKHVLMTFSGDLVLRTHMRMSGSWHLYRPGERWQRARRHMRLLVETDAFVAVGFDVQDAEFLRSAEVERHAQLAGLGPDLLDPAFDAEQAAARIRARAADAIGEVLLDQRVIAGIGNVFKSEVLFAAAVHPRARVASLAPDDVARIVTTAARLLRRNVMDRTRTLAPAPGRRTTGSLHPDRGLWVYGRAGDPCRRCGTPIEMDKQGTDARLTYWCGACQRLRPR